MPTLGQSAPPISESVPADPVESALAVALESAAKAGAWDVVTVLAKELEARRLARAAAAREDVVVPFPRTKR